MCAELTKARAGRGWGDSCIKKIAISEPLVDTVNPDQIVTKVCTLKTIDIHTCKKEDLCFSAPWKMVCPRPCVRALSAPSRWRPVPCPCAAPSGAAPRAAGRDVQVRLLTWGGAAEDAARLLPEEQMLPEQNMLRDDYLTAMVIYFDVGFTKIHKPIWLSTGPRMCPARPRPRPCPCAPRPAPLHTAHVIDGETWPGLVASSGGGAWQRRQVGP